MAPLRRASARSRSVWRREIGARGIAAPIILLAAFLAGAIAGIAGASEFRDPPPTRRSERPRFSFDAGAVWRHDTTYVAVEVSVPYQELMFRPDSGQGYTAAFDLIVALYKDKRQLAGDLWHETIRVRSYATTRAEGNTHQRALLLHGRPGELHGRLRVEVTVSEQSSGNEGRLTQEVEIPDVAGEGLVAGKIWFGRCPADSAGGLWILPTEPLVSRRFGAATGPVCVWVYLYGRKAQEGLPVTLGWRLYDDRREIAAQDTLPQARLGSTEPVRFQLPTGRLWLGRYELWVNARAGTSSATRIVEFEMDESVVSLGENPVESIALVRYIAKSDEIEKLEEAAPEERQKVWDEFWKSRDPTPGTEENEFKVEFFARVRYANEHFSSLGPGWRTDRGMIYIQYGPADQVESFPHNIDGPPYEVWTYYSLRRRFVFVDYDGFGRYELYTPGRR